MRHGELGLAQLAKGNPAGQKFAFLKVLAA